MFGDRLIFFAQPLQRSNLCASHRQRRWLTYLSYPDARPGHDARPGSHRQSRRPMGRSDPARGDRQRFIRYRVQGTRSESRSHRGVEAAAATVVDGQRTRVAYSARGTHPRPRTASQRRDRPGAGTYDDRVGLWMKFVRGETLREATRHGRTLGAEEAAAIGLKLCQALAVVHAASLVHADIKAQNVMREAGGRIVLMDFGAVRPKALVDGLADGSVAGTPLNMAPELFERAAPCVTSDIYALGVLLFHLVTKRFPVEAASMSGLVVAHAQGGRTLLRDLRPDLPPAFVDVVEQAITVTPSDRFRSAGRMERALADVISPIAHREDANAQLEATNSLLRRGNCSRGGISRIHLWRRLQRLHAGS